MRVSDFTPAPKRTSEHAFEVAFSDILTGLGIYNRHMADRVPGVPDRYVAFGRWIEMKSLYRKRGGFKFGEELSVEQKRTMADMWKGGDWVFYCALLDGWTLGQHFVLLPWPMVEKHMGEVMDKHAIPRAKLRWSIENWANATEARRGNR